MNNPRHHRTDYLVGDVDHAGIAANYSCGHCNAVVGLDPNPDPETGFPRIAIYHDDGCPVLTGTLSALPDAIRAATPDTFRP